VTKGAWLHIKFKPIIACLPRENLAYNMSKQKVQNSHKITRITKIIYVILWFPQLFPSYLKIYI